MANPEDKKNTAAKRVGLERPLAAAALGQDVTVTGNTNLNVANLRFVVYDVTVETSETLILYGSVTDKGDGSWKVVIPQKSGTTDLLIDAHKYRVSVFSVKDQSIDTEPFKYPITR